MASFKLGFLVLVCFLMVVEIEGAAIAAPDVTPADEVPANPALLDELAVAKSKCGGGNFLTNYTEFTSFYRYFLACTANSGTGWYPVSSQPIHCLERKFCYEISIPLYRFWIWILRAFRIISLLPFQVVCSVNSAPATMVETRIADAHGSVANFTTKKLERKLNKNFLTTFFTVIIYPM